MCFNTDVTLPFWPVISVVSARHRDKRRVTTAKWHEVVFDQRPSGNQYVILKKITWYMQVEWRTNHDVIPATSTLLAQSGRGLPLFCGYVLSLFVIRHANNRIKLVKIKRKCKSWETIEPVNKNNVKHGEMLPPVAIALHFLYFKRLQSCRRTVKRTVLSISLLMDVDTKDSAGSAWSFICGPSSLFVTDAKTKLDGNCALLVSWLAYLWS